MALGTGPIATENQFPCRTLVACLSPLYVHRSDTHGMRLVRRHGVAAFELVAQTLREVGLPWGLCLHMTRIPGTPRLMSFQRVSDGVLR